MLRTAFVALACGLTLAACGSSTQDRAISGGALGAAGGGVLGGATGVGAAEGALLGGAAGAATGALTDEDDIDLGEPVWERF
jgi:osmotically inducible lipoprotein OsmB